MKSSAPITASVVTVAALLAGCATTVSKPESARNPAPAEAFSRFSSFELLPINVAEGCNRQHGADVALREIEERLKASLGPKLATWNGGKTNAGKTRKLVIEPVCTDVKLVGTHARIWGGALAGSSAVVMKVRYTDAATGKTVAEPVFYQRAAAMGAAYSFGATDRNMLTRIVTLITDYTVANHAAAVGGPTGLQD